MFFACRTGDFHRLKHLVEIKEVDVDIRDKWDSTPLYYACLCGHKDVVEYLLERGAKCEANTFEGERCLYGALNDDIRNLLKSYHVISKRTIRRDLYEEFLRRLLGGGSSYSDVTFRVHGEEFPAHRCILSARCQYFANMFRNKWLNKSIIELNHSMMSPSAFRSLLQYLYTGTMDISLDMIEDLLKLAKQCQLFSLIAEIEDKLKKTMSWVSTKSGGVRVTNFVLQTTKGDDSLQMDLAQLAHWALPDELNPWLMCVLPFESDSMPRSYPDICFIVEEHKFMCHKLFFCGRSDYFKALLEDHFGECSHRDSFPSITIHDVTADVFVRVLSYIYTDTCELNGDVISDVLIVADMYLLPGLKRLCASAMISYVEPSNVISVIRTARMFNIPRLESHCAEYISQNISKIISRDDFRDLVVEDAHNIESREEADSIDIIDEIRFYVSSFVLAYSEVAEANEKLRLIDDMLEELNLDG